MSLATCLGQSLTDNVRHRGQPKLILAGTELTMHEHLSKSRIPLRLVMHKMDYCSRGPRHKGYARALTASISKDIVRSIRDISSLKVKKRQ